MILKIKHETNYEFSEPSNYGVFEARVIPSDNPVQSVSSWSTEISGAEVEANFRDCHCNPVKLASINAPARSLGFIAAGIVETRDKDGILGPDDCAPPPAYYLRETRLTQARDGVRDLASRLGNPRASNVASMHDLSGIVREAIKYEVGATDSKTPAEDAVAAGRGVCQDHAHIFLSAARHMGVPARYVSGYLFVDDRIDQEASHAWAEVFLAGLGWTGFDIANGISPDDRYVRLSVGLDYGDCAPIRGTRIGSGRSRISERLRVEKVGE